MTGYSERYVRSCDGLSLYYRDYGDPASPRLPVLCLAGLTRNSSDFHLIAQHLAESRRVLCPDYRGRGRSDYDSDWRRYEPRTYIEDARNILAVNGVGPVVIIGTSLGGLLAMGINLLYPRLVAGVILNDTGPELSDTGLQRIFEYIGLDRPQPDWTSAVACLHQIMPTLAPKADDAWWRQLAEGTFRMGSDNLLHFDWDVTLAKGLTGQQAMIPQLWRIYRALRPVPALAFRGALSDVLSESVFDRMQVEKPDLIRITVPDIGHTPSLAEPEAIRAVDGFLTELDSGNFAARTTPWRSLVALFARLRLGVHRP